MTSNSADIKYSPFPSFAEWAGVLIKNEKWERFAKTQKELKATAPEKLKKALRLVTRAAAVETGAIESLYDIDRGFTMTVAAEMATYEAAIDRKGEKVRNLIQSQLEAYDLVLDLATENRPIVEAFIRQLHSVLCKAQGEYEVHTPAGIQKQSLPLGEYKVNPNHVITKEGVIHAYAPVNETKHEMERLITEISREEFISAHPLLKAAYIHYAFVYIHPFADGNGRVARALASIYTYKAASVPILITLERKQEYFDALAKADGGDYENLAKFIADRASEVCDIVEASIRAAQLPEPEELITDINRFYVTKGGYAYEQVDSSGLQLLQDLEKLVKEKFADLKAENIKATWSFASGDDATVDKNYRRPLAAKGPNFFRFRLETPHPATANVEVILVVQVPILADSTDKIRILCTVAGASDSSAYMVELRDLIPLLKTSAHMRLVLFADEMLSLAISRLNQLGRAELRNQGYLK